MQWASMIIMMAGTGVWLFSPRFSNPSSASLLGACAAVVGIVLLIVFYPSDTNVKNRRQSTCPICGLRSVAVRRRKGSLLVMIMLLLLWLLPGVLYLIFRGGHVMACSKCGAKIADAV